MNEELNTNLEEEENKKSKVHYLWYFFLFTILLFFCVFGITYSVYYGETDDSEITTGQIIFTYSDVGQAGNGISISDAVPIYDSVGKTMVGTNQYFDFYVTTTTDTSNLLYKILLNKNSDSTLENQSVKVYLTSVMGSYEQEQVLSKFSDLAIERVNDKDYYLLFEKVLGSGLKDYSESYRLRMWVDNEAVNYEDKFFSTRVDVYAYQVEG